MSKKLNKVFMAFATGKESTEGSSVKRYIGVGSVQVIGINPTKEDLSKFYSGAVIENEPEYLGTAEVGPEGNKKKVNQVRLDFIIKTDSETDKRIPGFLSRLSESIFFKLFAIFILFFTFKNPLTITQPPVLH